MNTEGIKAHCQPLCPRRAKMLRERTSLEDGCKEGIESKTSSPIQRSKVGPNLAWREGLLFSVGAKGAESGVKGCQTWRSVSPRCSEFSAG